MNISRRTNRSGLSTIELLAAVTVIGIAAAIFFPDFQNIGAEQRSELAAYQLASDLQVASNTARVNQQVVSIRFEEKGMGNRYWVCNGKRTLSGKDWQVDLNDPQYKVDMTSAPIEINFDSNGCPDISAVWSFSVDGLHNKSVMIDHLSGEVVVQ